MAWIPYALVSMYKVFVSAEMSPWIGLAPSLFAKSSFAVFGFLHIINNKCIYEKINFSLIKSTKLEQQNLGVTLEFTTRKLKSIKKI